MFNYSFMFKLLYKYIENIMQNSACTIIFLFILLLVFE